MSTTAPPASTHRRPIPGCCARMPVISTATTITTTGTTGPVRVFVRD